MLIYLCFTLLYCCIVANGNSDEDQFVLGESGIVNNNNIFTLQVDVNGLGFGNLDSIATVPNVAQKTLLGLYANGVGFRYSFLVNSSFENALQCMSMIIRERERILALYPESYHFGISCSVNIDSLSIVISIPRQYVNNLMLAPWTCGFQYEGDDIYHTMFSNNAYDLYGIKGIYRMEGDTFASIPNVVVNAEKIMSETVIFSCGLNNTVIERSDIYPRNFIPLPLYNISFLGPYGFNVTGDIFGRVLAEKYYSSRCAADSPLKIEKSCMTKKNSDNLSTVIGSTKFIESMASDINVSTSHFEYLSTWFEFSSTQDFSLILSKNYILKYHMLPEAFICIIMSF